MAATTAMLNAPLRIGPASSTRRAGRSARTPPRAGGSKPGDAAEGARTGHARRHARRGAKPARGTAAGAKPTAEGEDDEDRQGSLRRHRARRTAAGPAIQRGLERELPHQHLT